MGLPQLLERLADTEVASLAPLRAMPMTSTGGCTHAPGRAVVDLATQTVTVYCAACVPTEPANRRTAVVETELYRYDCRCGERVMDELV